MQLLYQPVLTARQKKQERRCPKWSSLQRLTACTYDEYDEKLPAAE